MVQCKQLISVVPIVKQEKAKTGHCQTNMNTQIHNLELWRQLQSKGANILNENMWPQKREGL